MDITRASYGLTGDGVVIDDPAFPWLVRTRVGVRDNGLPMLTELHIVARDENPPALTAAWLCRLRTRLILRITAALQIGSEHENEAYYRTLATDERGNDHYRRVLTVASWASQVSRPGGGAGAVAEFWGVTRRTAFRWLRHARRTSPASAAPAPGDRRSRQVSPASER
jgi:hypothetical protein